MIPVQSYLSAEFFTVPIPHAAGLIDASSRLPALSPAVTLGHLPLLSSQVQNLAPCLVFSYGLCPQC